MKNYFPDLGLFLSPGAGLSAQWNNTVMVLLCGFCMLGLWIRWMQLSHISSYKSA